MRFGSKWLNMARLRLRRISKDLKGRLQGQGIGGRQPIPASGL